MSMIDESVEDLIDTAEGFGRGMVSVENVELARLWLHSMIAAALEDAERKGAEAMREAAAAEFDRRDGGAGVGFYDPHEPAEIVRALPLPTGPRQAELAEAAEWECKSGGLKPLSQRLYDKQPDKIKQHYTRIKQAVLLEDWQLAAAMSEIPPGDELAAGFSFVSWQSGRPDAASALDDARLVQAAVLSANSLEVRRG